MASNKSKETQSDEISMALKKLNFPRGEIVFKNLTELEVGEKDRHVVRTTYPLPVKEKDPSLSDFYVPNFSKSFDVPITPPKMRRMKSEFLNGNYDGLNEMEPDSNTVELAELKCELNALPNADGSCILSHNESVYAAAVYGPVELKQHKLLIDKAAVNVIFRPKCGKSETEDRLSEAFISNICETAIRRNEYPRAGIMIIVQEMQNKGAGSALACSINAVCLALIHSGISMNSLFAAVACYVTSEGELVLQPTENDDLPSTTFVFENSSDKIVACDSKGKIPQSLYLESIRKCQKLSTGIFKFYRDTIEKYASKI